MIARLPSGFNIADSVTPVIQDVTDQVFALTKWMTAQWLWHLDLSRPIYFEEDTQGRFTLYFVSVPLSSC